MLVNTLLVAMSLLPVTGPEAESRAGDVVFAHARHARSTGVAVWTNREEVVRRGASVRVFFETERDGYVTVFRLDTDGGVHILFPTSPWDNNFARGGRQYEVRTSGHRYAFRGDDFPGAGYVFAVTSLYPFQYGALARGARWDYRSIGYQGRVVGDPYVAVTDLIDLIVPVDFDAYDYDVLHYYVERPVEYPRFLCYDCHAYASFADWDPYRDPCYRFRIVVYNDPYYYPLRAYGGAPVVFQRPKRLEPRYIFKERAGSRRDIEVESRRPVNDPGARRRMDRPANSDQFGGVGRVATPTRRSPDGARRPIEPAGSAPGRRPEEPDIDERARSGGLDAVRGTPQRAQPRVGPRRVDGQGGPVRETPQSRPRLQPRTTPRRVPPTAEGRRTPEAGHEPISPVRSPAAPVGRAPAPGARAARPRGTRERTPPTRRRSGS